MKTQTMLMEAGQKTPSLTRNLEEDSKCVSTHVKPDNMSEVRNNNIVGSLKRDLMSYTHFGLIERLEQKEGFSHEDATILFDDMLRFLEMCGSNEGKERRSRNHGFSPPDTIDIAWHNFILFTKDYAAFCKEFFGKFIHHTPATSQNFIPRKSLSITVAYAKDVYGELSKNWASPEKVLLGDCDAPPGENCGGGSTNCSGK